MKTTRCAWRIYRFRVWAGLAMLLLLGLVELSMALRLQTGLMTEGRAVLQVQPRPFEVCDFLR